MFVKYHVVGYFYDDVNLVGVLNERSRSTLLSARRSARRSTRHEAYSWGGALETGCLQASFFSIKLGSFPVLI